MSNFNLCGEVVSSTPQRTAQRGPDLEQQVDAVQAGTGCYSQLFSHKNDESSRHERCPRTKFSGSG
jgi:hypothetical protein